MKLHVITGCSINLPMNGSASMKPQQVCINLLEGGQARVNWARPGGVPTAGPARDPNLTASELLNAKAAGTHVIYIHLPVCFGGHWDTLLTVRQVKMHDPCMLKQALSQARARRPAAGA